MRVTATKIILFLCLVLAMSSCVAKKKFVSLKAELEAAIVAGTMSGPDMAEAGRRLNHIGAEVAMLEERGLELNEQIDALNASAG